MKRIFPVILLLLVLLTACGKNTEIANSYVQITQEEAKKMMIEGSVDVQGTVKVLFLKKNSLRKKQNLNKKGEYDYG